MNEKLKAIIIENNVLVRQAISRALKDRYDCDISVSSHPVEDIEQRIMEENPDVLLLSIDEKDAPGFFIFESLRIRFPFLPVVIISPRNTDGGIAVITALKQGAVDFISKTDNHTTMLFARKHITKRVRNIVKAATQVNLEALSKVENSYHPVALTPLPDAGLNRIRVITIGACTGGPHALYKMIPRLPKDLNVPVVVTLHFPNAYTSYLANDLNKRSEIEVREVVDEAELEPGVVWLARGGYHAEIFCDGCSTQLKSHKGPRERGERPSINMLFRSAAKFYGAGSLGIILSGWGSDGLAGSEAISKANGEIWVQDPDQSIASELPQRIIHAGHADRVLGIKDMISLINNNFVRPPLRLPERSLSSGYETMELS